MQTEYVFKFTPLAQSDIEEALEYISVDLDNPAAARKLFERINSAIELICTFPFSQPDCGVYLIADKNIRHVNIGNYVLIYEVVEANREIHILRFKYSKMDFSSINIK